MKSKLISLTLILLMMSVTLVMATSQHKLSSGEVVNIKTQTQIQEQARLQIQERLNIKDCSCDNIELVEIKDSQNQDRLVYRINENKEGKIFGLFNKRIQYRINIDAETGETINIEKPWYTWMMRFGE